MSSGASDDPFSWEKKLLSAAREAGSTPLLLLNLKKEEKKESDSSSSLSPSQLRDAAHAARDALDPEHSILCLELDLAAAEEGELGSYPSSPSSSVVTNRLTEAIAAAVASRGGPSVAPPALPPRYLSRDAAVLLVVPMDAETPGGRLLRPQALVQEECLRAFTRVVAMRLDLGAARGEKGEWAREEERKRFDEALAAMMMMMTRGGCGFDFAPSSFPPPRLVVTDSQAIDVVHEWTMREEKDCDEEEREGRGRGGGGGGREDAGGCDKKTHGSRFPLVDITTFSIAMAARQSGGPEQLIMMIEGIEAAKGLKEVRRGREKDFVFSLRRKKDAAGGNQQQELGRRRRRRPQKRQRTVEEEAPAAVTPATTQTWGGDETKAAKPESAIGNGDSLFWFSKKKQRGKKSSPLFLYKKTKNNQGARVLVAEACNHNRITQACNDIGLVQIPRALGR